MSTPNDPGSGQLELSFSSTTQNVDALSAWRESRQKELETLGKEKGLPLGHEVTLVLTSGTTLFGVLKPDMESSAKPGVLPLRIGPTRFLSSEIASCVRET
jgi:hypothetical protein